MVRSIDDAQKAIDSAAHATVEPGSQGRSLWIKGNLALLAGDTTSLVVSFEDLRERQEEGLVKSFCFPRCTPSRGLVKTVRDGISFFPLLVTDDLLDQAVEAYSHILRVYGPIPRALFFRANVLKCKVCGMSSTCSLSSLHPLCSLPVPLLAPPLTPSRSLPFPLAPSRKLMQTSNRATSRDFSTT